MFQGLLLLSQGILTLGQALSLLPGLLNAADGEAPSMKLGCAISRFLLLILLSPGGELAVVARLPTVFFRWLGAIQNYLPLPYQTSGFWKVWPSLSVTESTKFPQTAPMLRPCVLGDPRSCQMDGRTISTNIDSWFNRPCKRRSDRVSRHTLRWFCQPWLERIISWSFSRYSKLTFPFV